VIVIDASALVKFLLREDGWEKIGEILREEECISLDHIVKEAANAIWRRAVVTKEESPEDALNRLKALINLIREDVLTLYNEIDYIEEAFNIAISNHITVYDALYIAQAVAIKAVLVTSDKKQASVAAKLGVAVKYIE